jgi:hypothetical protein
MPYVYTNPQKDTEIFSCDRVFVLSQVPLEIEGVASFRADKNFEHKNKNSDLMKIFKDDLKLLDSSQKAIISRLKDIATSIGTTVMKVDANVEKLICCQNDLPEPETKSINEFSADISGND